MEKKVKKIVGCPMTTDYYRSNTALSRQRKMSARKSLIIDSDGGVDDALAILFAAVHPGAQIEAVTTCQGNVNVDQATENVCRVLTVCGQTQVPVFKGSALPLLGEGKGAESNSAHGADGFGGVGDHYLPENLVVKDEHAATALVRLVNSRPGELTLVTLGPLTNLALALRLDPELPQKLKHLFIMGGNIRGEGGYVYRHAEFNFASDPEAARITLKDFEAASILASIMPCEVCKENGLPWDWFKDWTSSETSYSSFIRRVTAAGAERMSKTSLCGYVSCDLLAMVAAICPEVIAQCSDVHASVELMGEFTRGQMVVNWTPSTSNARIVQAVNMPRVMGELKTMSS